MPPFFSDSVVCDGGPILYSWSGEKRREKKIIWKREERELRREKREKRQKNRKRIKTQRGAGDTAQEQVRAGHTGALSRGRSRRRT